MNGRKPTPWGYVRWAYIESIILFIRPWAYKVTGGHKNENSGGYANVDSGDDFICTLCEHEIFLESRHTDET